MSSLNPLHRIDKQTSGLLILARNYKATVELTNQFKEKKINKFYLAILNGVPKKNSGEITNKIRVKKQKDALTKYFVLNKINKYSLIFPPPLLEMVATYRGVNIVVNTSFSLFLDIEGLALLRSRLSILAR